MITIVSGQGRCGSSLLMQMLFHGGLSTGDHPECKWPSFEDPRATRDPGGAWVSDYHGKALKILSPADYPPGDHECHVLWIDRDVKEQAKSYIKIQKLRFGTSGDVPSIVRKLRKDRKEHIQALRQLTRQIMFLRFEGLLREPMLWSRRIASFVGQDLDTDRMTQVVIPRKPRCAVGVMERTLAKMGPPSAIKQPAEVQP